MMPILDYINPSANITPYTDQLLNLSNNTFYKAVEVFTNALGKEIFFSLIFMLFIIGAYIQADGNKLPALALVLVFTVICGVLLSAIVAVIFAIVIALLMTDILYTTWVKR